MNDTKDIVLPRLKGKNMMSISCKYIIEAKLLIYNPFLYINERFEINIIVKI